MEFTRRVVDRVLASLTYFVRGRDRRRPGKAAGGVARSLRGLKNQQRILHTHVAAIENSLIFRFLRRLGGPLLEWKARFERLGRDSRFREPHPDEGDRE